MPCIGIAGHLSLLSLLPLASVVIYQQMQAPHAHRPSNVLSTESLTVRIASDPPGVIDAPARPFPFLVIHAGPSVPIGCRRGGQSHRGLAVHGDVDIVPAGTPSRWEIMRHDTALVIGVQTAILSSAAEECGVLPSRAQILNRFQTRDPQIEHIGWALKAAMEARQRPSRLYLDSLSTALAARMLERHSSVARPANEKISLPGRRLRQVLAHIDDNLSHDLSLTDLATVAGLGASQFKKAFRESVGLPVHRYVIERRVDRARTLLANEALSVAQIALETGFAHQSHLARHLRRVMGVSPQQLRKDLYRE
jgi:AraC family transcriptional regulator